MLRKISRCLLLLSFAVLSCQALARDYSALVVEPATGRVLYEKYADELRHPASVTKIMTLYLVFEALQRGDLTLRTPLRISRYAVLRPPSRLGLTAGSSIRVEDAILALVTRSANDVASVIAENLGGTESAFASQMTEKARKLGMRNTVFKNASGLPDSAQVTTAWDMYRLGKAMIRDFPNEYSYFSTQSFYYEGRSHHNHNHLMERYPGMDGIKTGFIRASGFNLVASAKQQGQRLIGVVFGGPSAVGRDRHMQAILDDGFAQLRGKEPGIIVADFDLPAKSRRSFDTDETVDFDSPQLKFGDPKRFSSKSKKSSSRSQASSPRKPVSSAKKSRSKSSASSKRSSGKPKTVKKSKSSSGATTKKTTTVKGSPKTKSTQVPSSR